VGAMIKEKFIRSINNRKLIEQDDSIVIAISGGPDSVAMTHLLHSIQAEYNLTLYGVHLDHELRGEASKNDAKFVEDFLNTLGIQSFIFSKNITQMAQELNITFEEAGRIERYQLFEQVKKETQSNKIAIGQNKNDQAETILFRLFRGTGLDGLTGIDYVREDNVIRPIMDLTREEIENYCEKHHLKTRTDHTNFKTVYSRNKIRLEVLPYLEKHFNDNIIETLWRLGDLLTEDKKLIDRVINDFYEDNVQIHDNVYTIKLENFNNEMFAMQSRTLRKIILEINDSLQGVSYQNIQDVITLAEESSSGKFIMIQDIKCMVEYGYLKFYKNNRRFKKSEKELQIRLIAKEEITFDNDNYKIYIDYDQVQGKIYERYRQDGDQFKPFGMSGTKKVKDFFIDEKVPQEKRDTIPLVCDDKEIIWIVGYRMNENYKITNDTQRIAELRYV
jgi:tRNA(Ile)-lysidine synthase